jgi:hypothetical protein
MAGLPWTRASHNDSFLSPQTGGGVAYAPEEATESGPVQFYPDAEAVLAARTAKVPEAKRNGNTGPFKPNCMAKLVRQLADEFRLA